MLDWMILSHVHEKNDEKIRRGDISFDVVLYHHRLVPNLLLNRHSVSEREAE